MSLALLLQLSVGQNVAASYLSHHNQFCFSCKLNYSTCHWLFIYLVESLSLYLSGFFRYGKLISLVGILQTKCTKIWLFVCPCCQLSTNFTSICEKWYCCLKILSESEWLLVFLYQMSNTKYYLYICTNLCHWY